MQYIPVDPKYLPYPNSNHHLPLEVNDLTEQAILYRIRFLRDTIKYALDPLWQRRKELRCDHRAELDDRMCRLKELLFEMESQNLPPTAKTSLEAQITALEKEKRNRDLQYWQDTFMLTKELREEEDKLRSALLDLIIIRSLS